MPSLKLDDEDFDVEGLEKAEYNEDDQRVPYQGPQPKKGTVLTGFLSKIWFIYNRKNDPMLKIIFEADEDSGFGGLEIWDNLTLNKASKFRWQPFLNATGLTLLDIKNRMKYEGEENAKLGWPVVKIARLKVGESAVINILTDRSKDNEGEWRNDIAKYMPYKPLDLDEDDEDEDDEEYEVEDDEEDEDEEVEEDEEDEEDEEEEEPEPAPRRKTAARSRGTRTAARPVARSSATRSGKPTRAAGSGRPKPSAKPAAGKKRRAHPDDPPF